jgi:hypothetical protein
MAYVLHGTCHLSLSRIFISAGSPNGQAGGSDHAASNDAVGTFQ